jgi:signal transduction histidine kinase
MNISPSVPRDAVIPELDERRTRRASDSPPGRAGNQAEVTLHRVRDRDRIAGDMNDIVVQRLFSAGLALETALGLMGDHPGAAKVQEAVGYLDLAIRDFRSVLFDRHQPDSPSAGQPGYVPDGSQRLTARGR